MLAIAIHLIFHAWSSDEAYQAGSTWSLTLAGAEQSEA